MTGRRTAFAVLWLGLLGSQAGHLVAYQIRFGAAAQVIQSSGAHAYFPVVAKTAVGAAAAALIGALLLVGHARVLSGRRIKSATEPSYVSVLAILFSIQLAAFAAQEIAEATIASSSMGSAADLMLWGTLGQLPIAAVTALAFRWLSARVEAAVGLIRDAVSATVALPPAASIAIPVYAASDQALVTARIADSSLAKRGPPSSLRISRI
jgi:hypothetical protein